MYGKDKFSKIKGSICNIPVEVDSVCKALLRADRNGVLVKLERHDVFTFYQFKWLIDVPLEKTEYNVEYRT